MLVARICTALALSWLAAGPLSALAAQAADAPSSKITPGNRGELTVAVTFQENGAGVAGLPVRVYRLDDPEISYGGGETGLTDAAGRHVFRAVEAGLYRVDVEPASAHTFGPGQPLESLADYHIPVQLGRVVLEPGGQARLDFVAVKGCAVSGRAVDASGKPHAEANLNVPNVSVGSSMIRTDADGRFTLRGCKPTSDLEINVQPKGYDYRCKARVASSQMAPAGKFEMPDIVVPARSGQDNVRATVTDDSGAPVKAANLRVFREDGQVEGLLAVRKGVAGAEFPPGSYRLNNRTLFGDPPRGYELYESQITVVAGQPVELQVQLKRRGAPAAPPPAAPTPAPSPSTPDGSQSPPP
jgi:hypothetical protein